MTGSNPNLPEDATPVDVTVCPQCGQTGRYDGRVRLGGRGIYRCPADHLWQDANETPDTDGYTPLPDGQSP